MTWDEIQKAIIGNLATTILLLLAVLGVLFLLTPFGYKIIRKGGRKDEEVKDIKDNNFKSDETLKNNPLLTSYPKPIENEVKGRSGDLKEIEVILENNQDVLLLSGMGGIGKTTLAAYYIQQNGDAYNNIAWINTSQGFYEAFAYNKELIRGIGIGEELSSIQTTTNPKDYLQHAYTEIVHCLNQKNGKLLLVIDNAMDGQPLQTLRDGLKQDWKLLVTAREPLGGFIQYPVGILKEGAAIELFNQYYIREVNDSLVKDIIQQVAFHTLSIELVAKTAQEKTGYTLRQLKNDLESKGLSIAKGIEITTKYSQHGGHNEYKTHIMDCLQAAFDVAQLGENKEYLHALRNLCLLPVNAMEFSFIIDLLKIEGEEETNRFNSTLNSLAAKGWLEKDAESYKMHTVLQETLQAQLKPQPQEVDTLVSSLAKLLKIDGKTHGIEKIPYIPYAERVIAYFFNKKNFAHTAYTQQWESIAVVANNLSAIYQAKGELDAALTYQLKDIEIREKVFDSNDPDLSTSYNNLSLIYRSKGDLVAALTYQLKDIEILEKVLNSDHPNLATSYNNLSLIYKAKGELDAALDNQLKALKIREKVLDSDHPNLANSYNNLSMIYRAKGELDAALDIQLKAIEIVEKIFGSNHPNLATSYNNLAAIYQNKGELAAALDNQLKALKIREKILDNMHPDLGNSYCNLFGIYEAMGQTEKAAEYWKLYKKIKEFNKQRGWA